VREVSGQRVDKDLVGHLSKKHMVEDCPSVKAYIQNHLTFRVAAEGFWQALAEIHWNTLPPWDRGTADKYVKLAECTEALRKELEKK
jgi:hypothetical protein